MCRILHRGYFESVGPSPICVFAARYEKGDFKKTLVVTKELAAAILNGECNKEFKRDYIFFFIRDYEKSPGKNYELLFYPNTGENFKDVSKIPKTFNDITNDEALKVINCLEGIVDTIITA